MSNKHQPTIYEESLAFHDALGGKLEIKNRAPLNNTHDLALAYTPGVAGVAEAIARDASLAYRYTIKKNTVAVISDGSAVLGLGNLGPAAALPVMEGKCALFKQFAGVDAFPICLDTQDVEQIIATVKALAPSFGGINLEDIAAPRCFEIEERLKGELSIPVMHDDQHGTAVVVLAGLINALKLKQLDKAEATIVINGAGAAGTAIAKLLASYGFGRITVCDRKGIICQARQDIDQFKRELAAWRGDGRPAHGDLAEALRNADIFIGVSARDVLTPAMVRTMRPQPVVFAMANPYPEIDPALAREAGAFIFATGRSDLPNQLNNVLAFPGIFRGALDNRVTDITPSMLLAAAENLAGCVKGLDASCIIPSPFDPDVAPAVARAIHH